jgi:subtilisin family serine protease
MIEVSGDDEVAEALRRRPEVDRLAANPQVNGRQLLALPQPKRGWLAQLTLPEAQASPNTPYGVAYTHAPEVWELGFRGQGIVIASQDTGVQWNHPALQAHYRGWDSVAGNASHLYNWYDAWDNDSPADRCDDDPQIPCDDNGHGTHTVGTMLGDATPASGTVLGMAPEAQWMGCRNMLNGVGAPASYATCFEFFLAPYPQHGDKFTDGRPDLAPHIINNSWSCPPEEGCDVESLRQVVETVRAAGQFVVSSAGNDGGNGCSSVINPIALYDAVFSVGAHDDNGHIASFSSRGPVTIDGSRRLKPEITAPGVSVYSSYNGGGYATLSGTSMAAPHVAGAVALLWSAAPELIGQIELTEQVLIKTATPVADNRCGEADGAVPNYTYGFGRLDVLAAIETAQRPSSLTVSTVDVAGAPMQDIEVELVDRYTDYVFHAQTGANGKADFSLLYSGDYELRFGAPGFTIIPSQEISVQPDERLVLDVEAKFFLQLPVVRNWHDSDVTSTTFPTLSAGCPRTRFPR